MNLTRETQTREYPNWKANISSEAATQSESSPDGTGSWLLICVIHNPKRDTTKAGTEWYRPVYHAWLPAPIRCIVSKNPPRMPPSCPLVPINLAQTRSSTLNACQQRTARTTDFPWSHLTPEKLHHYRWIALCKVTAKQLHHAIKTVSFDQSHLSSEELFNYLMLSCCFKVNLNVKKSFL